MATASSQDEKHLYNLKELRSIARSLNIKNRSKMSADELATAIADHQAHDEQAGSTAETHRAQALPTPPKLTGGAAKQAWIQAQLREAVAKTGHVAFGGTKYTHFQEHGVLELLKPYQEKVGAGIHADFSDLVREGNHVTCTLQLTVFDRELGQDDPNWGITGRFPCEGVDAGDKGINKMLTNGYKYALQKTFGIPTDTVDDVEGSDEAHNLKSTAGQQALGQKIPARKAATLRAAGAQAVEDPNVPITANQIKAFLTAEFGVQRVTELTAAQGNEYEAWFNSIIAPSNGTD